MPIYDTNAAGRRARVGGSKPVTDDYPAHHNRFKGKTEAMTIDVSPNAVRRDPKAGEATDLFEE